MSTTTSTTTPRSDIYSRVTDTILGFLESGVRPWMQPWSAGNCEGRILRPLRHNGQKYSGINILTLWIESLRRGFQSPYWLTFNQAKELGGFVKKGEQGSTVVYSSTFKKTEQNEQGKEVERDIAFLKTYCVFNAEQVSEIPGHFYAPVPQPPETMQRIERAERFFANTQIEIRHGGTRAYYAAGPDYVQMPHFATFRDAESYSATLAHEMTHATKHFSRLNRDFGRKKWGDEAYAFEELIAELGSAFLCADLSITPEVREDHAAYLSSWIKLIRDEKRSIFSAASYASKAVEFLHGLQPQIPA